MNIIDAIKDRKSVRTFDKTKDLDLNLLEEIKEYMNTRINPYGLKINWYLLNKDEYKLSSPVIVGEKYYILGKMKKEKYAEEAFGYEFEDIILYLKTKNIGTTWMAGTFDRTLFEKAINLKEDELMPCVSPIGYISKKMSMREKLMRKGIKADTRYDFNELFYLNDFNNKLDQINLEKYKDILELVRLAPSAVNKQPWRLLIKDNKIYFYKKSSKGFIKDGFDVQKVDMGISMYHLIMGLKNKNINYEFEFENPNIENIELEYISTIILK